MSVLKIKVDLFRESKLVTENMKYYKGRSLVKCKSAIIQYECLSVKICE